MDKNKTTLEIKIDLPTLNFILTTVFVNQILTHIYRTNCFNYLILCYELIIIKTNITNYQILLSNNSRPF